MCAWRGCQEGDKTVGDCSSCRLAGSMLSPQADRLCVCVSMDYCPETQSQCNLLVVVVLCPLFVHVYDILLHKEKNHLLVFWLCEVYVAVWSAGSCVSVLQSILHTCVADAAVWCDKGSKGGGGYRGYKSYLQWLNSACILQKKSCRLFSGASAVRELQIFPT